MAQKVDEEILLRVSAYKDGKIEVMLAKIEGFDEGILIGVGEELFKLAMMLEALVLQAREAEKVTH